MYRLWTNICVVHISIRNVYTIRVDVDIFVLEIITLRNPPYDKLTLFIFCGM